MLTVISVDRLYVLILGLRYRQNCHFKARWTQGIAVGLAALISPLIAPYYSFVGIAICLLTSVCCYTEIYKRLQRQHAHIQVSLQLNILHGPSMNPYGKVQKDSIELTVDIANTSHD